MGIVSKSAYNRESYLKNKEKISEKSKEYRLKNKEKISERKKEYRLKNKEKISEKDKEYRLKNKEKISEKAKEYRLKNKEKISKRMKEYVAKNIELYRRYNRKKTECVSDYYVKRILLQTGFIEEQISPELIELKRITLKTERLCRRLKNS